MIYLFDFGIACAVAYCISELLSRSEFDLLYLMAAGAGMVAGPVMVQVLSIAAGSRAGQDWATVHAYGAAFGYALLACLLYGGVRGMAGLRGLALGAAPQVFLASGRVAVTRARLAKRAERVAAVVAATPMRERPSFGSKRLPRR